MIYFIIIIFSIQGKLILRLYLFVCYIYMDSSLPIYDFLFLIIFILRLNSVGNHGYRIHFTFGYTFSQSLLGMHYISSFRFI